MRRRMDLAPVLALPTSHARSDISCRQKEVTIVAKHVVGFRNEAVGPRDVFDRVPEADHVERAGVKTHRWEIPFPRVEAKGVPRVLDGGFCDVDPGDLVEHSSCLVKEEPVRAADLEHRPTERTIAS